MLYLSGAFALFSALAFMGYSRHRKPYLRSLSIWALVFSSFLLLCELGYVKPYTPPDRDLGNGCTEQYRGAVKTITCA